MNIIILGGTGFLGRALSKLALADGHRVTCLARGTHDFEPGVIEIRADRSEEQALTEIRGHEFDALVDLTSHPLFAARAYEQIAARHYLFVSSTSVYVDDTDPAMDESAQTFEPLEGDMATGETYGAAKVACENIYRKADTHTIIRPGLIGGAGDRSGRTGYYPWRAAQDWNQPMVVPDLTFPVAIIDAHDLAVWILTCITHAITGIYNANGDEHTLGEVIAMSREIAGRNCEVVEVSDDVLSTCGVNPWWGPRSLPLWIPGAENRATLLCSSRAAEQCGLTRRPLRDTLASAGAWHDEPPASGLPRAEEAEILQA